MNQAQKACYSNHHGMETASTSCNEQYATSFKRLFGSKSGENG